MENNIKKKLDKAPITEVVIGLAIEGIFNTPESIDTFYEQSTLKEHFMNKEVIKAVTFEISEKPKISKDVSSGFAFTNADKTETINIELNKIMYSDKSKYVSYEIFIEKFGGILDSIIKFAKSPVKINEIGLRYVNNFDLNPFKLGKDFKTFSLEKILSVMLFKTVFSFNLLYFSI